MGLAAVLLALMLAGPALSARAQPADEALSIRFFKAGKADAFLLRAGGHAVLIDTAETDDAKDILKYLDRQQVRKLDLLILTHFDKGHIGGAPDILRRVAVDRVLMPTYFKRGQAHSALREALTGLAAEQRYLQEDLSLTLGPLAIDVYTAQKDFYAADEDDDFSLVVSVRYGEQRFLFTGDILDERIGEMLQSGQDWRSQLLKLPHHGRMGQQTEALLKAVAPQQVIITCSKKNPPDEETLALLERLGIPALLTMDGDIMLTSDGQGVHIQQ